MGKRARANSSDGMHLISNKHTLGAGDRDAPIILGDAPPTFFGTPPGSPAAVKGIASVREPDTRGNGGGFAPLGTSLRRVAGVSHP